MVKNRTGYEKDVNMKRGRREKDRKNKDKI